MSDTTSSLSLSSDASNSDRFDSPWFLLAVLVVTAAAGGMAWGIRGQYGHETGAMMFGVLAGFSLVMFFIPQAGSLQAARVVALMAVAVGFGGSMSYGETIGLTQDSTIHSQLVEGESIPQRHWEAYWWGMLGLFVKGGLWIGFAGAFLGVGLGGKKYKPLEMLGLAIGMVLLVIAGIWVLNRPFDPANKVLPTLYFSDDWYWEPNSEDLKPRDENWGGQLFAFAGLLGYLAFVKRDSLAVRMAFWGVLGGLGFPIGQSIQAAHAFDPPSFDNVFWMSDAFKVNFWNIMEMTFGTVAGLMLAMGLWVHRKRIVYEKQPEATLPVELEWGMFLVYLFLLMGYWLKFYWPPLGILEVFHLFGIFMGIIPLTMIVGGRYWPGLYIFPLVACPIVAKTLRDVSYRNEILPVGAGWVMTVILPMVVLFACAIYFGSQYRKNQPSIRFSALGLLVTSTIYFWLNFAFFDFPWPWEEWTGRTHSGIINAFQWVILLLAGGWFLTKSSSHQLSSE